MSEVLENPTENISDSSEEMGSDAKQIDFETEKIAEIIPELIRYRGQRGPDKSPRNFNRNCLRNLKQYQNIPIQKPSNSNIWIWILIGIVIALVAIILGWKIYDWGKKRRNLVSD